MIVTYWLDNEDTIIKVSDSWNTFAAENNGARAFSNQIKGRKVFKFVSGDTTRMILDLMLRKARTLGMQTEYHYRCDSLTHKRYMIMRITPEKDKILKVDHITEKEVEQNIVPHFNFEQFDGGSIRSCSMCKKVLANNEWVEPDQAIEKGYLDKDLKYMPVFSICPECRKSIFSKARSYMAS